MAAKTLRRESWTEVKREGEGISGKKLQKFFRKIFWGPPSQGVRKSQKMLQWVDRDCRAVYKTEKIVALWQADRQIIDVEILPN